MMRFCLAAAALTLSPVALAETTKFDPGNWSVDILIEAGEQVKEQQIDMCMTEESASIDVATLADAFAGGAKCTAGEPMVVDAGYEFDLTCAEDSAFVSGTLTLIDAAEAFELSGPMVIGNSAEESVEGLLSVTGTRTGDCE